MAKLLEEAGFDSLHVDAGCYDSWYWAHPPTYQEHGCMVDMAAQVKKVVKVPVTAVGKLDIPALAEKTIIEGKADIVALGRALLADPYWVVKTAEGKRMISGRVSAVTKGAWVGLCAASRSAVPSIRLAVERNLTG
jgi:2-enoate reductase